ncbi:MAG: cytochrome c3 family protein [Deltaproteobacteria bacterium]|nr:cytochrome c3 family protein [Deltaproteobacteria bacterium]
MKKGLLTVAAVLLMGFLFIAAGVLTAADVSDDVQIENKGYKKDQKKPVKLTHKTHIEEHKVTCIECHHDYKDGKNIWKEGDPVAKCITCHDPLKKKGDVKKLKLAYHNNCKECHKTINKEGKKAPLKKCKECHGRK